MLTKEGFDRYTAAIGKLSKRARADVEKVWARARAVFGDDPEMWGAFVDNITALVCEYGDVAATLAAQLFDEMRASALGYAEGGSGDDYFRAQVCADQFDVVRKKVDEAVTASAEQGHSLPESMAALVDTCVKDHARRTIEENCHRDKQCQGFQVVPSGPTTCSFCTMQAGRGIVYDHDLKNMRNPYHDNCDCQPIPVHKKLPSWFDASDFEAKYYAARQAYDRGDYSDELAARIAAARAEKGKKYSVTNAVMAVMHEQNPGMK